jgi:uncharacterized protein (DUF58 family)
MQVSHTKGLSVSLNELFRERVFVGKRGLHLRKKARAHSGGLKRSSIRGRGMEFFESRPYVPHDEMRAIDWKVSARLDKIHTKIFIEERDRPIVLVLDFRPQMYFGSRNCFKTVLMARIAAQLAFAAQNGGDSLSAFLLFEHGISEFRSSKSRASLGRLFGMISSASARDFKQGHDDSAYFWDKSLMHLSKRVPKGASLFLISDFWHLSSEYRASLFALRKKCDLFALVISDPLEEELPDLGLINLNYFATAQSFDSSNKSLREAYRAQASAKKNALHKLFLSLSIPEIGYSTANKQDHLCEQILLGKW